MIPKTEMQFTDNTGAEVTCDVSDPATAAALACPDIAERAPCPEAQRFGPPGDEPADNLL